MTATPSPPPTAQSDHELLSTLLDSLLSTAAPTPEQERAVEALDKALWVEMESETNAEKAKRDAALAETTREISPAVLERLAAMCREETT